MVYTVVKNIHPKELDEQELRLNMMYTIQTLTADFPKNIDSYIVIYDFEGGGYSNINFN